MNCPSCSQETEPGEACARCGAPARASPSRAAWLIGGAIGAAVVVGLLLSSQPKTPPGPGPERPQAAAPRAGPFANVPAPASRAAEAAAPADGRLHADELFNAAMMASEGGDAEAARSAVPEALAAYRALGPLDDDATFHVSLLQLSGGDLSGARATAESILARHPTHLLALSVAARAAGKAGDSAGARAYNEKLLASYDTEVVKQLREYLDHQRVLPIQRDEAQRALAP